MPYLNLRISREVSTEEMEAVVAVLMKHTTEILGKRSGVTAIDVECSRGGFWFVGGQKIGGNISGGREASSFYLNIKITEGTNTKTEKAHYVQAVYTDLERLLGPLAPATYIVIDDLRADAWGYDGRTQEERFITGRASAL